MENHLQVKLPTALNSGLEASLLLSLQELVREREDEDPQSISQKARAFAEPFLSRFGSTLFFIPRALRGEKKERPHVPEVAALKAHAALIMELLIKYDSSSDQNARQERVADALCKAGYHVTARTVYGWFLDCQNGKQPLAHHFQRLRPLYEGARSEDVSKFIEDLKMIASQLPKEYGGNPRNTVEK
jgi:hypothetical protein